MKDKYVSLRKQFGQLEEFKNDCRSVLLNDIGNLITRISNWMSYNTDANIGFTQNDEEGWILNIASGNLVNYVYRTLYINSWFLWCDSKHDTYNKCYAAR